MGRRFVAMIFVCFLSLGMWAQTIKIENEWLEKALLQLEQQTGCRIYWRTVDVKDIRVSLEVKQDEPLGRIMDRLLAGTGLNYSVLAGKTVFVLKGKRLLAELPSFAGDKANGDYAAVTDLLERNHGKASGENIVYTVGNSKKKATERTVELRGVVTSFKTGEPLAGVNMVIKKPEWSAAASGTAGEYVLQVSPGPVEIELSGMGIADTRRQLMVYEGGRVDMEVDDAIHTLGEVTVLADKREVVQTVQMGVQKLVSEEMKLIPTAFGEADVLKIVQTLPGVKTVGEASSGLNVRGGATDQNLILFNEATIYNPTHLFGFFSAFNSGLVSNMELYKSTIPAMYGGRISSVLDINSRQGDKEKYTGTLNIGLLTSSVCLEGPIQKGKSSLLLSARTTYSDWLLNLLPEDSGYKNGNAGFYDLNLIFSHRFNAKNNLVVDGYYSHDRFSFSDEEKYAYANANASAKWTHSFNENSLLSVTGGYDHYDYETKYSKNEADAYKLSFDNNQFYLRMNYLQKNWEKHTLNVGLSGIYYSIQPGKTLPLTESSLMNERCLETEKALESAAYINEVWDVVPRLSFNLGVRYAMFNALGPRTFRNYAEGELPTNGNVTDTETVANGKNIKTYHGPEFRFSFRYAFTDDFSVKGGVNTMRQFIHKVSNTMIMSPTDTWKLSDKYIKPQSGTQFSLGLYKNFMGGELEASVEGYYKILNDYLDYRSGAQLLMNSHLETDVVPTEGRAYGVELMLKKPVGKLNGWLSYTYARTELRQSDPRILTPVNKGEWYPAEYDKPHEVKLVGNYQFTKRYSVSFNVDYSTGRPQTMPVSKYYDHTIGATSFFYTNRNEVRIPDYFRMDLSFNILPTHRLTAKLHSSITLGVYNLTGRKNVYSIYYVNEGEEGIKGYKMSIFGSPIPFITYNVKF